MFPLDFFRRVLPVAALAAAMVLAGCSGTIHRQTELGTYSILAIDARQRLVISGTRTEADGSQRQVICAEPSPDAIVAAASYFGGGITDPNGRQGSAGAGVSEAVGNIGLRTQTIQLLRDGYFRVCEAYLNGAIGSVEYVQIVRAIDRFMVTLVAIEAVAGSTVPAPITLSTSIDINQTGAGTDAEAEGDGQTAPAAGIQASAEQLEALLNSGTSEAHQSEAIRQIVFQYLAHIRSIGMD